MNKCIIKKLDKKYANALKLVAKKIIERGFRVYLVGGPVRDLLLSLKPKDLDLATDAEPDETEEIFRNAGLKVITVGKKFGTIAVRVNSIQIEITTFRAEANYDGRRPGKITFAKSIEADLSRRDFTVNAMAIDLSNCELIDPFGGRKDVEKRLIRAVGDPKERFGEDYLRMLRACRFASKLDFNIEKRTLRAIAKHSEKIVNISAERIRDEIIKLLGGKNPFRGLECMRITGLMEHIIPELLNLRGLKQPERHRYDAYYHTLKAVSLAPRELRLLALLHDIGKAKTVTVRNGRIMFPKHAEESAKMASRILTRLKFPKRTVEELALLIRNHEVDPNNLQTEKAIRRFISRVKGIENALKLVEFRTVDLKAQGNATEEDFRKLEELKKKIIENSDVPIEPKDIPVNGYDIMKMGISGKTVGEVLSFLHRKAVEKKENNNRKKLLELAENYIKSRKPKT